MNKPLNWLKEIRLSEKMTQRQVADKANMLRNHYSRIETGTRGVRINSTLARKISKALNFEKYGLNWTAFYPDDNPLATDPERGADDTAV